MKKIILIIALSLVSLNAQAAIATHTVCASGCDFTTLAGALGGASAGDFIQTNDSATYTEALSPTITISFIVDPLGSNTPIWDSTTNSNIDIVNLDNTESVSVFGDFGRLTMKISDSTGSVFQVIDDGTPIGRVHGEGVSFICNNSNNEVLRAVNSELTDGIPHRIIDSTCDIGANNGSMFVDFGGSDNTRTVGFELINTLVFNFAAGSGEAVRVSTGGADTHRGNIVNSTFDGTNLAALGVDLADGVSMINSIVTGYTDAVSVGASANENMFIFSGYENDDALIATMGTGCVTVVRADIYDAPGSSDFHNKSGGNIIDAGTDASAFTDHDLDNVSRPQGVAYDMGAYELAITSRKFPMDGYW